MGQRHQIFLLVKILHHGAVEPRYRCIVAKHHQWLYGYMALEGCKSFLDLIRQEDNATLAMAELASIASGCKEDEDIPRYSAPFLSWLLNMSLAIIPEHRYVSSVFDENPNTGTHSRDNNDGITVIDVTDPSSPAYCFVSIRGLEAARKDDVMRRVPLTAEAYVRAYVPLASGDKLQEQEEEEGQQLLVSRLIDAFNKERVIPLATLAETWPGDKEGYERIFKTYSASQRSKHRQEVHVNPVGMLTTFAAGSHSSASFDDILNSLFEVDRGSGLLDLSQYALTCDQIVDVTSTFPTARVLNLNRNMSVDGTTLLRIIASLPNLSRLIVYDCPNISLMDIDSLRSSRTAPSLKAIYHRHLMIRDETALHDLSRERFMNKGAHTPPMFTLAIKNSFPLAHARDGLLGCSTPFLSPRALVIAMCDLYEYLNWALFFDISPLPAKAFFSSLPRAPDVPWKERAVGNIPADPILATEGWSHVILSSGSLETVMTTGTLSYRSGFVRYQFADAKGIRRGQKPSLESVEVMNLTHWLEEVDSKQEVEKEWVRRLERAQRLVQHDNGSGMIEVRQAVDLLTGDELPLFTN